MADWRGAVGNWAEELADWNLFVTLTFSGSISEKAGLRKFERLVRDLARDIDHHVHTVYSWGPQQREIIHLHALLGGGWGEPIFLRPADVKNRWRAGHSVVRVFERGIGGGQYILGHRRWEVNVACPRHRRCRRSGGCVEAPGPWPSPEELASK